MQELYKNRGVIKSPIDYTPIQLDDYSDNFPWLRNCESEQTRALEISQWLRKHPEVTNWVAVDDLNMSKNYNFQWDSHRNDWVYQILCILQYHHKA